MKRRFWQWVHDRLELVRHWVYRTKLAPPPFEYGCHYWTFSNDTSNEIYWSKDANLYEYPEMKPVPVDYYRINPDGSFTLLDGPTDTAVIR